MLGKKPKQIMTFVLIQAFSLFMTLFAGLVLKKNICFRCFLWISTSVDMIYLNWDLKAGVLIKNNNTDTKLFINSTATV